MNRWDLLLIASVTLIFGTAIAGGWLHTTYGQEAALQMPVNWILLGLLFLFMGGATLGFYRGTWRETTGGRGGRGLFIFWALLVLAGSFILRGFLRFLGV